MTGGRGADAFAFVSLGDFGPADQLDRITDFSHADADTIDLSAIDPDLAKRGNQAFTFIGSAAFSGSGPAELRAVDLAGDTVRVEGDWNHDGTADFTILVDAAAPLVAADFIL